MAKVDELGSQLLLYAIEGLRHRLVALTANCHLEVNLTLVQLHKHFHEQLRIFVVLPAMWPNQMQAVQLRVDLRVHDVPLIGKGMKLDGKIQHFTFLLDALSYVL